MAPLALVHFRLRLISRWRYWTGLLLPLGGRGWHVSLRFLVAACTDSPEQPGNLEPSRRSFQHVHKLFELCDGDEERSAPDLFALVL